MNTSDNDSSSNMLKLFTCNANPSLAKAICKAVGKELGQAVVDRFPDGESRVRIQENVRGADIFLIQVSFISLWAINTLSLTMC